MCPFSCGREIEIKEGPYKLKNGAGAEYETTAAFGAMCLISDVEAIAYLNDLCNKFGVDTISTGCTVAFALECYEKGMITQEEIGFPLEWGDTEAIIKLTELICKKEGIGKILSNGNRKASEVMGKGSEDFLTDVKGLEAPMHDPRAYAGQALSYMTACCGANHEKGDWFQTEIFGFEAPEWDIINGDNHDITGRERGVMHLQDLRGIDDSAVVCNFHQPSKVSEIAKYVTYASGFYYTPRKLMQAGERIFNLKRVISCKLGITREDDKLPKHVLKVMSSGKTAGLKLEMEGHLKEYYRFYRLLFHESYII